MRSAARALIAVLVVGAIAFAVLLVTKRSDDAFSMNVPPSTAAVKLEPGAEACQGPINTPIGGAFDAARVRIGTVNLPGPEIAVTLRDRSGALVARTTIPAGYADNTSPRITLGPGRRTGSGYRLCLENRGQQTVYLYGSGGDPNPSTTLTIDGKPQAEDLALTFQRPSRSLASSVGDILERATLFRTPRLSSALYGLLLVVLLGGAGLAMTVALRSAERDDDADGT